MLKYAGDRYFDFFKSKGLPTEELTAITKVLANKYNIQL